MGGGDDDEEELQSCPGRILGATTVQHPLSSLLRFAGCLVWAERTLSRSLFNSPHPAGRAGNGGERNQERRGIPARINKTSVAEEIV